MDNDFDFDVDELIEKQELAMESMDADGVVCDAVCRMADEVKVSGMIDKHTMETIDNFCPDAIDPEYPINSYTTHPTSQNLEVGMESILLAVFAIILALVSSMVLFIAGTISTIKAKEKVSNNIKKFFDKTKKHRTRDEEMKDAYAEVVASNKEYSDKSAHIDRLIEFYSFGGEAVNLFRGWDVLLTKHIKNIDADIEQISSIMDKYRKEDISAKDVIKECDTILTRAPTHETRSLEQIIDLSLSKVDGYSKSALMREISTSLNFVRWFNNNYSYDALVAVNDDVISPKGASKTYDAAASVEKTNKGLAKIHSKLKSARRNEIPEDEASEMNISIKRTIMTIRKDVVLINRFMNQYSYLQGFYAIVFKAVTDASKKL